MKPTALALLLVAGFAQAQTDPPRVDAPPTPGRSTVWIEPLAFATLPLLGIAYVPLGATVDLGGGRAQIELSVAWARPLAAGNGTQRPGGWGGYASFGIILGRTTGLFLTPKLLVGHFSGPFIVTDEDDPLTGPQWGPFWEVGVGADVGWQWVVLKNLSLATVFGVGVGYRTRPLGVLAGPVDWGTSQVFVAVNAHLLRVGLDF